MKIRIIDVPPGEAPERIRRAWVGLTLPLAPGERGPRSVMGFGVLSTPQNLFSLLWQLLTGRYTRRMQYVVPVDRALRILAVRSPEAADWWRDNAPHLLGVGGKFAFAAEVCEERD